MSPCVKYAEEGIMLDIKALIKKQKEQADWFIKQLVKGGVPRRAIATNDFNTNLVPRVYVTIPYGTVGGGKQRSYQRWNNHTVGQALKFWRANSKKRR